MSLGVWTLDLEDKDNVLGLGVGGLAVEADDLGLEGTEGDLGLLGVAQILVRLLQPLRVFQHIPLALLHRLHPLHCYWIHLKKYWAALLEVSNHMRSIVRLKC